MNKKEFIYVSPTATVKEMQTEGVLCMSIIRLGHQDWEYDEDLWS